MMLTEDELREEIKVIEKKIEKYENDIKPFTELEHLMRAKIGATIDVNVVIGQKSSKVAMISSWKKEISVLNRVLEGKRMPPLSDDSPSWEKQKQMVLDVINQIKVKK